MRGVRRARVLRSSLAEGSILVLRILAARLMIWVISDS